MVPGLVAVVPLKALADAKGRLAPELDPPRRRALTALMFTHVVTTCLETPSVAEVVVIAGDAEAAALAEASGARALVPPRPGLDAAMAFADAVLARHPATLVVAADLPLLGVEDLEAVVESAGSRGAAVVVAPTADGGTGGLLRRPADVIPTAYGPGSAAAHRLLAAEAGVLATEVHRPGFAQDVDTAGQLRAVGAADHRLAPFAG
jgi:2-phospho-L-lactate/phosphoenolpyruvate guanylyltransferase